MFARIGMVICFALIGQICLALEAPVSLEALAVQSDRIVRGKVMNLAYSHETNRYGDELIYTYVTVRVSESLKGDRSDLVLKVEGGTHNGVTLSVSDGAVFQNGEEVLIFVKRDLLEYRPLSGMSSKYTISAGGKVLENGRQYTAFRTDILRVMRENGVQR